ncbi:MAG: hypothetical protein ABIH71_06490 [Candidatus Omnitrophota bacterium]
MKNILIRIINSKHKYYLVMLLSLFLVSVSIFIPVKINTQMELSKIQLGFPLKFLIQDQGHLDPPFFPWKTNFMSPWEYPFYFSWVKFSLSFFTVFIITSLILEVINKFWLWNPRKEYGKKILRKEGIHELS